MRIAIFTILLFAASSARGSEYVVLFGTGLSQRYVPEAEPRCPADEICVDVVYRWKIRVEKIVSGNIQTKSVKAAMIQHTEYVNAHKRQALFVLSRIADDEKRKLLGADYWIEEYQTPEVLYCLSHSGEKYGLEKAESIGFYSGTNCVFRVNE